jgi:AcrR family transcriptional regulator
MVTSDMKSRAARDSRATRERILDALGTMVMRDGLASIGVNALAREVGCDKVLIYRYFGDLDGVFSSFAARGDFWWSVEELTGGIDPSRMPLADGLKLMLRRHAHALRARPVTLAVLAAELVDRTPLVIALETVRERRALQMSGWIVEHYRLPPSLDFAAVSMILGVAVNYLAVRARTIRVMSGVKIETDADWERVFAAMDALIDGVLPAA